MLIFHRLKNEFISSCCMKKTLGMRRNTPPGKCWKPLPWCGEHTTKAVEPGATPRTLYFLEKVTKCSFLKLLGDRSLGHFSVIVLVLLTEPPRAAEPEKNTFREKLSCSSRATSKYPSHSQGQKLAFIKLPLEARNLTCSISVNA